MTLISQPGSDYQITEITLDAGHTRDIIHLLLDAHSVLDHLYLDGTQPAITAPAEACLRECLDIRQKVLPSEHPDVMTARWNLKELLKELGRVLEVEELERLLPKGPPPYGDDEGGDDQDS